MNGRLGWTAAVVLSLSSGVPAVSSGSPAAPNNAPASKGAAPTTSNAPNPPSSQVPAPSSAAPAANGTSQTPSNSPYPLVTVTVNRKQLATRGILVNGRTLLPISDVVEKLGGKAIWDPQAKMIWAAFPRQKRTLRMVLGSTDAQIYQYKPKDPHRVGGLIATTHLDLPPMLVGAYLVAPVDAAANIARAKVFFRPDTKQVSIVGPPAKQTASR
jgi:hypothetical protein